MIGGPLDSDGFTQRLDWAEFVKFIDGTYATLAYIFEEQGTEFYRIVCEPYGGVFRECFINRDGSEAAAVTDFEDNYKTLDPRASAADGLLTASEFETRVGEVQETPTTNTILGRLKDVYDAAVGVLRFRPESIIDVNNSTTTPLGADAEFTGAATEILHYSMIYVTVKSDVASATDGLIVEQSPDGTNWDTDDVYTIPAEEGKTFSFQCAARYLRVRYVNGPTIQSYFRLQVVLKPVYSKPSSHRISDSIDTDDDAELVKSVITGQKPNGSFDNVALEADGRLRVSSPAPSAPAETTAVRVIESSSCSPSQTIENIYTITNGATLTVQRVSGASQAKSDGGVIKLIERTTSGGDSLITLPIECFGNTQALDVALTLVGDGDRRVVLQRRNNGGSSVEVHGEWVGFEE